MRTVPSECRAVRLGGSGDFVRERIEYVGTVGVYWREVFLGESSSYFY